MTLVQGNPNRTTIKQQQDMVAQLKAGTLTKPIPTKYQISDTPDELQPSDKNGFEKLHATAPVSSHNPSKPIGNYATYTARIGPGEIRRNPSEVWCGQTTGIIEYSNAQRSHAKAMRNMNVKEAEISRTRVLHMNKEVNEKLQRKVSESSALSHRLQQCADSLQSEMERLIESRNVVSTLLQNLIRPIRKCDRRKSVRTLRPEREKIEDAVEVAIQQERLELQNATQLLTEHVSRSDRHIDAMRKLHESLENDINDKNTAITVDKECLNLIKTSGDPLALPKLSTSETDGKHYHKSTLQRSVSSSHGEGNGNGVGLNAMLLNLSTVKSTRLPTQWKESSNVLMARSKDLINESLDLRTTGSALCKRVKDAQQSACTFVEDSLKKKLQVTTTLHNKLSKQRLQLNQELERLNEQRERVLQEISDISGPLEIVSRRLELRRSRPSREQVRDAVEEALETEYSSLKRTAHKLDVKLEKVNKEIAAIHASQQEVDLDLKGKARALELDQECFETSSTSSSISLPPMNCSSRGSARSSRA